MSRSRTVNKYCATRLADSLYFHTRTTYTSKNQGIGKGTGVKRPFLSVEPPRWQQAERRGSVLWAAQLIVGTTNLRTRHKPNRHVPRGGLLVQRRDPPLHAGRRETVCSQRTQEESELHLENGVFCRKWAVETREGFTCAQSQRLCLPCAPLLLQTAVEPKAEHHTCAKSTVYSIQGRI